MNREHIGDTTMTTQEIITKIINSNSDYALQGFNADLPDAALVRLFRTRHSLKISSEEEEFLFGHITRPSPQKVHEYDAENALELYEDGSLYVLSSLESEVWCSVGDFISDRLDEDELTVGEREFFGITVDPEDASDFVITVRGSYYGPLHPELLLRNENYEIEVFESESGAKARISELEDTGPILHLGHNQYAADEYIIIPRR